MNIDRSLLEYAERVFPQHDTMATGGGCDYIYYPINDMTDMVLIDAEDAGSPYSVDSTPVLDIDSHVYLFISDIEPHDWQRTPVMVYRGTARQCLEYMASTAANNTPCA